MTTCGWPNLHRGRVWFAPIEDGAVAQMRAEIRAQGQQLMKKLSQANRAEEEGSPAVMAISMVRERSALRPGRSGQKSTVETG